MKLEDFLRIYFDVAGLASGGREIVMTCPECGKSKHFFFNIDKKIGHCFACEFVATLFKLKKIIGESDEYIIDDKIETLVEKKEDTVKDIDIFLPKSYNQIISSKMSWLAINAKKYLNEERNITDEEIQFYNIGYCSTGNYSGYIIIPVYENRKLVYYTGRTLFNSSKKRYINPTIDEVNSSKSEWLFNIDNVKSNKTIVIVEGVFDAMRIKDDALAILGSSISDIQMKKILSLDCKKIIVALDPDAIKKSIVIIEELMKYKTTYFMQLDKDPADHSYKEFKDKMKEAKLVDFAKLIRLKTNSHK